MTALAPRLAAPSRSRPRCGGRRRLLLLGLFLSACRPQADGPQGGDDLLARGDGWTIRADGFRHWWASRPGVGDSPQARSLELEKMIERTMLVQAARKAGLDLDPEVAAQVESILLARLREVQLEPRLEAVQVSEDDLRAVYDAERDTSFTRPPAVRLAVLWFNTRGQEPLEARYLPRLEQIRDDVRTKPGEFPVEGGFGALAVGNTEHRPSRLIGGDLGWLEATPGVDPWRNAVLEAASGLENPGDLSDVVVGKEGLFLVRLTERRAARVEPFEAVSARIRDLLLRERRNQVEEEFTRAILARGTVERFPDVLAALKGLPPRGGAAASPPRLSVPMPDALAAARRSSLQPSGNNLDEH